MGKSENYIFFGNYHSDFNVKTCFSQKQFGDLEQSSCESLRENRNESLYK